MKSGRSLIVALLIAVFATSAFAQAPGPERYVIIGVFRVLDNAVRYTDRANKLNFSAGYIQNPRNKLYYVYIFQSLESRKAFAFMMKVRLDTEFKEAWVYKGSLGVPLVESTNAPDGTKTPDVKEEPVKEPVTELDTEFKEAWVYKGSLGVPLVESTNVPDGTKTPEVKNEPVKEPVKEPVQEPVTEPVKEPVTEPVKEPVKEEPVVEVPKEEPVVVTTPKVDSVAKEPAKLEPRPVGKPFFFKLTSNETGEPLVGEIHVFDANSTSGTYQAFPANQVVYLPAPRDPSQVYAISTLSAGYQEMTRPLNYADPASSSAEVGSNNEFIIALPVVHVKMGDYIEFSNVRFFQNSVVLQPESREELDGLVELLKQNPRYKIAIHGHCNGDQDRNIVVRGQNQDFFTANTSNQRKTVSAKEFTELRAELVKDYMISQGIDGKRITTKGEGGKALIYPTNSTLANRNDRVEIEVKRGK